MIWADFGYALAWFPHVETPKNGKDPSGNPQEPPGTPRDPQKPPGPPFKLHYLGWGGSPTTLGPDPTGFLWPARVDLCPRPQISFQTNWQSAQLTSATSMCGLYVLYVHIWRFLTVAAMPDHSRPNAGAHGRNDRNDPNSTQN